MNAAASSPESASAALMSGHWFRIAALKPRLRSHVRLHRHVYRGQVWYVVHDGVSGQHHRLNAAAAEVLRRLDGRRTLQALWEALAAQPRDGMPTQQEVLQVLGQLNAADLLVLDGAPEVAELIERRDSRSRRRWMARVANPLSLRWPLWDPDAFLAAAARWLPRGPRWVGWLAWLALVLPAALLLPAQWDELTHNFSERLLSLDNLWVMAVAFPLLKAAHELAHGLAVKRGGAEVHEMGLMFLLFFPVPYVDASGAHAFADKGRRLMVSAAGMKAELTLAAIAFYAWLLLEPGLPRAIAYDVFVLGSVTTVVFNANPLLRYDGYYMLADALEIPNLAQRASRHWQHLATRHLFGVRSDRPPPATAAERRWFVAYAPLAFCYRIAVTLGLAWFVAQQYFVFGVLLAAWAVASGVAWPVLKALKALFVDPRFAARAARVWLALLGLAASATLLLFVLPLPHHTRAEGIVALPERALLRAGGDGFVHRVALVSGDAVTPLSAVLEAVNPLLAARGAEQEARVDEVQARLDAAWAQRPVEAAKLAEQLARERAVLDQLQDELTRLVARPQVAGRLLIDSAQDLPGRFLKKGELIGHVVGPHAPIVRVVVPQDAVDFVRADVRSVEVRLAGALQQPIAAALVRATPKAAHELPSAALGQPGGGRHVVDPRDDRHLTALESLFEFELQLPASVQVEHLGTRAYVSFAHADEAIAWRWLRQLRRQLLSKLAL